MEGKIKYTTREVEKITLEYHSRIMPSPVGMVWAATTHTYGGVDCDLIPKDCDGNNAKDDGHV